MNKLDKQFNRATSLSVKRVARLATFVAEILTDENALSLDDDLIAENIHTMMHGRILDEPKVIISKVWELPEAEA